ncbi:MAG: type I restriction endonuclease subunit R [Planctomycetota bacterium]|nr:type I restriction endonuclease subunit R [Planctomycetota bacterium]
MVATDFLESDLELVVLEWFQGLGYETLYAPEIAPSEAGTERASFHDVLLTQRLRDAIDRLNPQIPAAAREDAFRKVAVPDRPTLIANNRIFHRRLRDGVEVEYRRPDGSIAGDHCRIVDFENPENYDWLALNQFTVIEGQHNRRAVVVVFLIGLPLGALELKNPADEEATIQAAYKQLQTYKEQIPSLFAYNEVLVASDGLEVRIGSLTAGQEWFKPWRTIEGENEAPHASLELEVLIRGVFEKGRFLKLLQHFVAFEDDRDSDRVIKILAGYHQFHAVQRAVEATLEASRPEGDKRCGVVWPTQGSGRSLSMMFYAAEIVVHPAMENPTLVCLTDRNDLDDQLFAQFARCSERLRQNPVQAESAPHLRELLKVASGRIVFTTIQKFLPGEKGERVPMLSDRHNIVVLADEAHRSQYDMIDGLARNMRDALPHAAFLGFTGTPIEKHDANTRAVFGQYVSIYDIERAVRDKATVPIYYESRIAKLSLNEEALPAIDDEQRIALIARDLVEHFERRYEAMEGKAMIVCMSRRICVELVRRTGQTAARLARRRRREGRVEDRDDRVGFGRRGVATAHPQQGAAEGPGAEVQGPGGLVPGGARAGHVADGF